MSSEKEAKAPTKEDTKYEANSLNGEAIATGIAIASVYHYKEEELKKESNMPFDVAIENTLLDLDKESKDSEIFLAQKELLYSLKNQTSTLQEFENLVELSSTKLLGTKLESKISDYIDILQRVKKYLGFELKSSFPNKSFILIADNLLPSQVESLAKTLVEGVVLKDTALTSHTAILLRGAGISSIIADGSKLKEGSRVILDANSAQLIANPTKNDLKKAQELLLAHKKSEVSIYKKRFESALTKDAKRVKVFANITDEESALRAKEEGAEGIGLLRTEFLFKKVKPSLEMQINAYSKIFDIFDDVTVRTLDVGGDKELAYIDIEKEQNPFLGIRGIRLLKSHPNIIEEQLLAIFKASNGKKIKVMFPMVSSLQEFIEAKEFSKNIAQKNSIDISNILFGIMIEVPSVLFLLKEFNELVDFYSIGTNDLTQYLFAIERTHKTLKTDALSNVVFSAIKNIVEESNKPISICGELASNKKAIKRLIDLGIETLSVSEKNIAQTKEEIRGV
jgi:phosphocarrier protein FPr